MAAAKKTETKVEEPVMLQPGLKKGDRFIDGGLVYKIEQVNEDGTYISAKE